MGSRTFSYFGSDPCVITQEPNDELVSCGKGKFYSPMIKSQS